jgi:hypothetical protein
MDETENQAPPESLLPYDAWTEEALRQVMVRALRYAGSHGLPGEHHFYVTFRTDHPGVVIPARLRAQYREEMTIVIQHQFWDLTVDEVSGMFSVGLSFGGVGSMLQIPLAAVTAFADPHVQYGLRFRAEEHPVTPEPAAEPVAALPAPEQKPQVVSLDAFRKRGPAKES